MSNSNHTFYIPVMGTAFTIDAPLKVAKYGISSVISIGDNELCEQMREYHSKKNNIPFEPILKFSSDDYRSERITSYLNMVYTLVKQQIETLRQLPFKSGSDIDKYFEMLPEKSTLKQQYQCMLETTEPKEKEDLQKQLRQGITAGSIDVNIMTKIDRDNRDKEGKIQAPEYGDAITALRGFANSQLSAAIIFSAGFNRRLYAYCEQCPDFFPDKNGHLKKRIILKVSDYRSSWTQGKFLAKKGIWISEHRIESGLNCGGHAFATNGHLMGPILEEFKVKRSELTQQLFDICNEALEKKDKRTYQEIPETKVTVQGGIGTAHEQGFLLDHYGVNGTGWATPFLLVPEVTTVDDKTRAHLAAVGKKDLYLSDVSPLGVPFNTVRGTDSEKLREKRIEEGKPGSPCPKGHLISNTEFTKIPICTASKLYQRKKIEHINKQGLGIQAIKEAVRKVVAKTCLCEDLAAGSLRKYQVENKREQATAVCPGPNLAYFSKMATLKEMVGHIYGRLSLLNDLYRPNMFVSELKLYIDYLAKQMKEASPITEKQTAHFNAFKQNLIDGIEYYMSMVPKLVKETEPYRERMKADLISLRKELEALFEKQKDHLPDLPPIVKAEIAKVVKNISPVARAV
ncbi:MAG: hypothetical protein HRT90_09540 [Candidatus Margulisbacteria bacterium]|nr:hypothetical protein [Candidatus Margulisiibacteriota bacterium]